MTALKWQDKKYGKNGKNKSDRQHAYRDSEV